MKESNKPLVSIIVPTFNHEKYIKECLESILFQTYSNWEALIIDDGSSDKTGLICKKIAECDTRIKYHYQKNKGITNLYKNYNFCLKKSKGKLIAILEGDDKWPKNKLKLQVPLFENKKIIFTYGDGITFSKNKKSIYLEAFPKNTNPKITSNKPIGSIIESFFFNKKAFKMPTCTTMFRKEILVQCGGFYQPEGCSWLDRSTFLLMACYGEFKYIRKNLGFWRRHPLQVTQNLKSTKTTNDYIFLDKNMPDILKKNIMSFKQEYKFISELSKFYRKRQYINFIKYFFNNLIRYPLKFTKTFIKFLNI